MDTMLSPETLTIIPNPFSHPRPHCVPDVPVSGHLMVFNFAFHTWWHRGWLSGNTGKPDAPTLPWASMGCPNHKLPSSTEAESACVRTRKMVKESEIHWANWCLIWGKCFLHICKMLIAQLFTVSFLLHHYNPLPRVLFQHPPHAA